MPELVIRWIANHFTWGWLVLLYAPAAFGVIYAIIWFQQRRESKPNTDKGQPAARASTDKGQPAARAGSVMGRFSYLAEAPPEWKSRWCLLRAIEWGRWPVFVSQPLVPIAIYFADPRAVVLIVWGLTWLWAAVRYRFVNLAWADAGATFVHLKWPAALLSGGLLAYHGQYSKAALAALWPIATIPIMLLTPRAQLGVLEREFARRVAAIASPGHDTSS